MREERGAGSGSVRKRPERCLLCHSPPPSVQLPSRFRFLAHPSPLENGWRKEVVEEERHGGQQQRAKGEGEDKREGIIYVRDS